MESLLDWHAQSAYLADLGVALEEADAERLRLRLPFSDANANPGGALHGGCAASLAAAAGLALTRGALGEEAAPFATAELQVSYLAAAVNEDVVAIARLLRRGKALCFTETSVETAAGKPIAHATAAVRALHGEPPAPLAGHPGDDGAADPGAMGPHVQKLGFIARLGIRIEHMAGGTSRLRMPLRAANGAAGDGVHEGALLALLDTCGAMASWGACGPGPYKASTPALQAQLFAPPPAAELVAYGHVARRDGEHYWSDVTVAGGGETVARGTVLYRIAR